MNNKRLPVLAVAAIAMMASTHAQAGALRAQPGRIDAHTTYQGPTSGTGPQRLPRLSWLVAVIADQTGRAFGGIPARTVVGPAADELFDTR